MASTVCPNGHRYDPDIFGPQCPFCAVQKYRNKNNNTKESTPENEKPDMKEEPIVEEKPEPKLEPKQEDRSEEIQEPVSQSIPEPVLEEKPDSKPEEKQEPSLSEEPEKKAEPTPIPEPSTPPFIPLNTKNSSGLIVAMLFTYDTHSDGEFFPLRMGYNKIGRSEECDISCPNDTYMSEYHLFIKCDVANDKVWAEDQKSTNGTYVNSKKVSDKVELNDKDVIVAGRTKFLFMKLPNF